MLTTIDKAIAGGVVSFLANYLLAHFQITLPPDFQLALSALIVSVMVWATPNVKKVLDDAQKPVATGGPGSQNASIKGAIVIGFLVLGLGLPQAKAADVAKPATKLALLASPCTITSCTGFYAGFNVAGIATNANVLAGGINGSVAGGGQNVGAQIGYQFWNGTWFFGPELGIDYTYGGSIVPTLGVPKWLGYEIVKFGSPISTFFGNITPANATGLPSILINNTLSPYLFVGAAQRNWGTGIASGGGITFLIPNSQWFLDARYMNIQYTGGNTVQAGVSVPQENLIMVGMNYKF